MCVSHSVVSDSLRPRGLQPSRLLCPWNSPGKNARVGYHALLQGTFLTQGSNPGLLHCRQVLYPLSHQGTPPREGEPQISTWSQNSMFYWVDFKLPIKDQRTKLRFQASPPQGRQSLQFEFIQVNCLLEIS